MKRFAYFLLLFFSFFLLNPSPATAKKRDKRPQVEFQTTMGTFRVALFNETPIHRDNFLKLVGEGFYDGLLFHRVIQDFMIQGGDPDSRTAAPGQQLGDGDLGYTLAPEFQTPYLYHWRGALAAAREPDEVNPGRRSSACQFYIVWGKTFGANKIGAVRQRVEDMTDGEATITADMAQDYDVRGGTPHLDGQYTVFGEVVEGLSLIGKIQKVATDKNDRPLEDVRILSARIVK